MTKDRLITIQTKRGYKVTDLGRVVLFTLDNYTATWFFNPDGTVDESLPAQWTLEKRAH